MNNLKTKLRNANLLILLKKIFQHVILHITKIIKFYFLLGNFSREMTCSIETRTIARAQYLDHNNYAGYTWDIAHVLESISGLHGNIVHTFSNR